MDKYEYNLKLEEIDKLVDQGDYEEAANLADTIEWKRVRNVRTLCLISEIYEAADRLEDSKQLLERAFRRAPVGKTVLYRLVEVTTALQQYDEALEYYTEYVQAAPHDNNRYILKYRIYRGRGSAVEDLIGILEEYLGQEYTERWAYELAKLYQQAGQMQKCLAACDDLVLWFHTGKYVRKALELKKKYAALTPKQQQIYEECIQQEAEDEIAVKEEQEAEQTTEEKTEKTAPEDGVVVNMESSDGEVMAEKIIAETEKEIAVEVSARKAQLEHEEFPEISTEAEIAATREMQTPVHPAKAAIQMDAQPVKPAAQPVESAAQQVKPVAQPVESAVQPVQTTASADVQEDMEASQEKLQMNLAKSMREIISGVVKRVDDPEEDIPASVENHLQMTQKVEVPEVNEPEANKLSIDDILLSMGDKGKEIVQKAAQAADYQVQTEEESIPAEMKNGKIKADAMADEDDDEEDSRLFRRERLRPMRTMTDAATEGLTDAQREALQYTSNPEKLLRNKGALPTYSEEPAKTDDADVLGKTRRMPDKEELAQAAKTIPVPTKEISDIQEITLDNPEEELHTEADAQKEDGLETEAEGKTEADASEQESEEAYYDDNEDYLVIPEHLRNLFSGFNDIPRLEDQIANAIIQAESKEGDRTSKSGNILIFGAHGSGKTTLAMNLAKAIAQDRGNQVVKMAKIYASDLNRKDIAATIAKIAGGTLIIEEAGDLEDGTVEQLTTAMEFRTDGLIVILEDEQKYIHELLMRHPRFTMKFTAQIYIPEYSVEELLHFGELYANAQDYVLSDDGYDKLYDKVEEQINGGVEVTIKDVIDRVAKAIQRSNKFFRKMKTGKKRFDENDYIILFAKDFK